jgi:hypothetical protein
MTIPSNSGPRQAKQPHRFPRLIDDGGAAALEKLFWAEPKFKASVSRDGTTLKFTYRVPTPSALRSDYPGLYDLFLVTGSGLFVKALNQAYAESKSGSHDVHQFIGYFLRRVLNRALKIWLEDSLKLYKHGNEEQLEGFDKKAKIKRSQPDARVAYWIAKRFRELTPAVNDLRKQLGKRHKFMSDRELSVEVQKYVPPQNLRRALERIFVEGVPMSLREVFTGERLSTSQIVRALIECEMEDLGLSLGHISWRKYVNVGRDLLLALDTVTRDIVTSDTATRH